MTETRAKPAPQTGDKPKTKQPWLWNVVLLDSDDHTYDYVIRMVQELFAHDVEKAFLIADRVNHDGRAVCLTTHKEHAELKRDQVLAFGRDPMLTTSKGSMSAIIEPAEVGGDDGDRGKDEK
ncbi:MAG: ATP-dependent Clp protease adaptor ClpS [Phycisphaeraceae bacterium]|nr:ATP-dependent Clp protease adaptor ClpS [Phycisphaeraceae bacterium]